MVHGEGRRHPSAPRCLCDGSETARHTSTRDDENDSSEPRLYRATRADQFSLSLSLSLSLLAFPLSCQTATKSWKRGAKLFFFLLNLVARSVIWRWPPVFSNLDGFRSVTVGEYSRVKRRGQVVERKWAVTDPRMRCCCYVCALASAKGLAACHLPLLLPYVPCLVMKPSVAQPSNPLVWLESRRWRDGKKMVRHSIEIDSGLLGLMETPPSWDYFATILLRRASTRAGCGMFMRTLASRASA